MEEYYYCLEIAKRDGTFDLEKIIRMGGFIHNANCRINVTSTPEVIEWSGTSFLNGSSQDIRQLLLADSASPLATSVTYDEHVRVNFDSIQQVNTYFSDSKTGGKESYFSYRVLLTGDEMADDLLYRKAFVRLVKNFCMVRYPVF